jgi:hypothetical protein
MGAGEAVVAVVAHFLKPEKYPLADSTTLLTVDGAGTAAAGEAATRAAAAGGCLEGGGSVFDRNIDKRPVDGGEVEGAVEEAEIEELETAWEDGVLLVVTVLWLCVC